MKILVDKITKVVYYADDSLKLIDGVVTTDYFVNSILKNVEIVDATLPENYLDGCYKYDNGIFTVQPDKQIVVQNWVKSKNN